jgi:hypothetical protein
MVHEAIQATNKAVLASSAALFCGGFYLLAA